MDCLLPESSWVTWRWAPFDVTKCPTTTHSGRKLQWHANPESPGALSEVYIFSVCVPIRGILSGVFAMSACVGQILYVTCSRNGFPLFRTHLRAGEREEARIFMVRSELFFLVDVRAPTIRASLLRCVSGLRGSWIHLLYQLHRRGRRNTRSFLRLPISSM